MKESNIIRNTYYSIKASLRNLYKKAMFPIYCLVAYFVGWPENQYSNPIERFMNYKRFMKKLEGYWCNQAESVRFFPLEIEDGIDYLVYSLVKKVMKTNPKSISLKYWKINGFDERGTLIASEPIPRILSGWITLFDNNSDPYNMKNQLFKSLQRYLGIAEEIVTVGEDTDSFTWKINDFSDEEKIVKQVKGFVLKGYTVELNPEWCVALIDKNIEHCPGLDSYWTYYTPFYSKRVDNEKLIKMLDEVFGQHKFFDRILSGYTWQVT